MHRPALLLAAFALSCGTPDNQIVGTISATANSPVVSFDNIRSAISGTATVADANGQSGFSWVVILSDKPKLCDTLKAHPDYFHTAQEGFIAMVLYAPPDRLGGFQVGRETRTSLVVYATNGPPATIPTFPSGPGSFISLTDFDQNEGGHGSGTFDGIFADEAGQVHELLGRFKTNVCPAIGALQLP